MYGEPGGVEELEEVRRNLFKLFINRRQNGPDGRAVFEYKFSEEEYLGAQNVFRRQGSRPLQIPAGQALFVLVLAEWFRRERQGGNWDWQRPLAAAGLQYAQNQSINSVKQVSYQQLRAAIIGGLEWWKRPPAVLDHSQKYVWAIVREAGFPLAMMGGETDFRRWIERSISLMFQGVPSQTAVRDAGGSIGARDLVNILFNTAVDLCEALFELKRKVAAGGQSALLDPILYLDETEPEWLSRLPADAGAESIRSLIEEVIEKKSDGSHALEADRILRWRGDRWQPEIRFSLTGALSRGHLAETEDLLRGAVRARVYLRAETSAKLSQPIGLLEKITQNGEITWECRPLLDGNTFKLPLHEPASLVIQVEDREPVVLNPSGAEPQESSALCFAPIETEANKPTEVLRLLKSSSVRWGGPYLYLLLDEDAEEKIEFDADISAAEVVPFDGPKKFIKFSGSLSLEEDGVLTCWQTGCEQTLSTSISCFGAQFTNATPAIYRGPPNVFVKENGIEFQAKLEDLKWRAKGSRNWVPASRESLVGEGELAIFEANQIICRTRVRTLPSLARFEFRGHGAERALQVSVPGVIELSAKSNNRSLAVDGVDQGFLIDLSSVKPASQIKIELGFDQNNLVLNYRDLGRRYCLLSEDGDDPVEREVIGANTLSTLNCWSIGTSKLILEVRSRGLTVDCVIEVAGETPLAVFGDEIRSLFSLFDDRDTRVRVIWQGDSGWSSEIRRFEADLHEVDWALGIDQIRNALKAISIKDIIVIPILNPELARSIDIEDLASAFSFRQFLSDVVGSGPWIVSGRLNNGGRANSCFIDSEAEQIAETPMQSALLHVDMFERLEAIEGICKTSSGLDAFADYVRKLLTTTRRYQVHPDGFDALKAISRTPELGLGVLARLREPEMIAALLDLELDLPFSWVLTPPKDWEAAFTQFIETQHRKYRIAGVEDLSTVERRALRTLDTVRAFRPELSAHVAFCALRIFASMDADAREEVAPIINTINASLREISSREPLDYASAAVRRGFDLGIPAPNLGLSMTTELSGKFDPQFEDVISVPFFVAAQCLNRGVPMEKASSICRRAKLFDADYFAALTPFALLRKLNSADQS